MPKTGKTKEYIRTYLMISFRHGITQDFTEKNKVNPRILYNSVPERNKPQAFFILPHSLYSTVTAVPQAVTISILPLPPTVS